MRKAFQFCGIRWSPIFGSAMIEESRDSVPDMNILIILQRISNILPDWSVILLHRFNRNDGNNHVGIARKAS